MCECVGVEGLASSELAASSRRSAWNASACENLSIDLSVNTKEAFTGSVIPLDADVQLLTSERECIAYKTSMITD